MKADPRTIINNLTVGTFTEDEIVNELLRMGKNKAPISPLDFYAAGVIAGKRAERKRRRGSCRGHRKEGLTA